MTDPALAEAYAHCETLVRDADRATWLATLFASAERRSSLHAVLAFRLEIEAVRDKIREPLAGELRLQWWTDAIEGEARGDVQGHPVAAALIDTIRMRRLSRPALTEWIEAKRQDLYDEPIADMAAFDDWAGRTEGTMIAVEAAVLADGGLPPAEALRHAGRVAAVLTAFRMLGRRQAPRTEVRLPLSLLNAEGIGTAEVAVRRMSPGIGRVLAKLAEHAETEMAALRVRRSTIPDAIGPAFLPINLAPATLRHLARPGYDPFAEQPDLPLWRKQWLLWRAARRGGVL